MNKPIPFQEIHKLAQKPQQAANPPTSSPDYAMVASVEPTPGALATSQVQTQHSGPSAELKGKAYIDQLINELYANIDDRLKTLEIKLEAQVTNLDNVMNRFERSSRESNTGNLPKLVIDNLKNSDEILLDKYKTLDTELGKLRVTVDKQNELLKLFLKGETLPKYLNNIIDDVSYLKSLVKDLQPAKKENSTPSVDQQDQLKRRPVVADSRPPSDQPRSKKLKELDWADIMKDYKPDEIVYSDENLGKYRENLMSLRDYLQKKITDPDCKSIEICHAKIADENEKFIIDYNYNDNDFNGRRIVQLMVGINRVGGNEVALVIPAGKYHDTFYPRGYKKLLMPNIESYFDVTNIKAPAILSRGQISENFYTVESVLEFV